jgi:predicted alpha/beta-fold hydrolase
MDLFRLVMVGSAAWIAATSLQIGLNTAQAQTLANPPQGNPGFFSFSAIATVLESIADLSARTDTQHAVQYTLPDGTQIGGLLFTNPSKGVRPLVIADYGLMSSRDSGLAGDFVKKVVAVGNLNANFLVINDISGADFYAANRSIGLGGYDAGRIIVELAQQLKKQGVAFSALTLMGESLGGLAVLEALIEDHRLKTHLFKSAITFSAVVDEDSSTASVMSAFNYNLRGISGPEMSLEGMAFLTANMLSFNSELKSITTSLPDLSLSSAGDLYYNEFQQRLQSVNTTNWNPAVSRASVESYIESSAALIQQIAEISTPVIVVHAENDPVVPYSQFQSFAQAQSRNVNISTLGTSDGSHCGFIGAYGASYVASLVNRAIGL